jgi:YD repeat-containing protein
MVMISTNFTRKAQGDASHLKGAGQPALLAVLKYFYSPDGNISAREVNSVLQKYEYDLKGQLLAVKNDKGNAVEKYAYDPAGNILKKTVEGKTTAFEYDAANQLVSAKLPDGTTKRIGARKNRCQYKLILAG